MKLPAFQFYPGDWLKDPNLRRCTHAAKGVWIDLLCLMFESEERGVLATAGRAWSDEEIALAVGGDQAVVLACVQELTLKGVANRQSNGALYSKRLVRDEHKRKLCIEAGKRGGNPNLAPTLKGTPKGRFKGHANPNLTPSSSSSVSSSDNSTPPPRTRETPQFRRAAEEAEIPGLDVQFANRRKTPPTQEEALNYGRSQQWPEATIKGWWLHRVAQDWVKGSGVPITNWQADLQIWINEEARRPKRHGDNQPRRGITADDTF